MSKKNDLSGSHIVLDGALYMCNQGAVPSSIVVTNNNKLFVQNKKVATVDDTTFQTPALTFGTCLLSPKKQAGQPCEYANGKWDSETCYIDKIVLDSSKMYCSAFAPQGGEISCLFHGQVMGVTATDFANFEPDAAIALNSLLSLSDFEEKKSEKPKGKDTTFGISAIELYRTNQIGRTFIPTPREKNPKHIRPSEILILEAKTNSKTNLKGQPISWIVFQKEEMISEQEKTKKKQTKITVVKNLKIYPKVGSPFSIKLKKSGKYYIEAVGNGNNFKSLNLYYQMQKNLAANDWVVKTEKLPLDAKCCKEIIVCSNDIIGLTPLGNKEEIKLPTIERYDLSNAKTPVFLLTENFQKITKYTSSAVIVRPNEPLEIKVDTIFEVKDDEYLTVHLNHFCIDYMLNSEVETSLYSFDPKTKIFKLKPPFNTGDYRIRFELNQMNVCTFMRPKTLGIGSLLIHCISDYLDVNASSGGTEKPLYIRPGASLQFRAVTNNGKNKIDGSKIVWNWGEVIPPKSKTTAEKNKSNATQEPSEPAKMTKTGDKLIINSEKKEYKLRVEAYVNDSNFIFEGKRNRDIETAKKWSFECEVKKNRIKKIWLDADEAYIGMTYNMNLECLYPDYIPSADGEILGSLNGEEFLMENGKRSFVFDTAGRQNLSLKMGNTENITEEFEVYDINVGEWGFFDSERHHIKQVGFSTKFNLLINIPAFKHLTEKERSEIRLELWDERTGTKLETEVLNEVKFDEKGYINVELMGYEITDRTDDITLSCAFVNLPYHVSGLNDEKHNGHFFYTKAKKLIISEKVYINGFFAGNSGNPQKSILRYGTEAKIVLYLHNFSKNKRENSTILLVENNSSDDLKDTLIWKSEIPQPNDDGRVEIAIPENIIKEDDHNAETPRIPRLFYFKVVYHNPITEELSLLLAYPAQKIGDDFKIEINEDSVKKLNCNYFWQLKYVPDNEGDLNDTLAGQALTVIGEELKHGEGRTLRSGECPRCNEEAEEMLKKVMTVARFNQDAETKQRLRTICETYTQYMDQFYMNTCWMKAHYFAQISVESGENLKCKAENVNYSRARLEEIFRDRVFHTTIDENNKVVTIKGVDGKPLYLDGVKDKLDKIYNIKDENARMKAIANFVYFGINNNSKEIGSNDGWKYRGGGMIQLTGKGVYEGTEKAIAAFIGKKIYLGGADNLSNNVELSTIASMAYLARRKIHLRKFRKDKNGVENMYFIANGQKNEYFVNKIVGTEHKKDKDTGKSNYDKKQDYFNEFYKVFQTSQCNWDEEFTESEDKVNIYRIDLDKFSLYKYQENEQSDEFIYKIYNYGKKVCEDYHFTQVMLPKRGIKLMPFPESGPNWGRYGHRDSGGDNFVSETTCGCLLGLFYSLPLNGHDEKYFYDDITIYTIDNTHSGHKSGNDIDVRYPNGTDQPVRFWDDTIQQCFNGNKAKFIAHLESFVRIARKWCFVNNFTHEEVSGTTALKSHQHHIHLGNIYHLRYLK